MSEKFSTRIIPGPKYKYFDGRIISKMPELVSSGMKFANYDDLITARLDEPVENDKQILINKYFSLAGTPALSDPSGSGEQKLIFSLEDFPEITNMISTLNPNTKLNNSYSLNLGGNKKEEKEFYESVKGDNVFVLDSNVANELRNNAYSNQKIREEFIEAGLFGDAEKAKAYKEFVFKSTKGNINNKLGFYPGNFTGLRLVWAGSVGVNNSIAYCDFSLSDIYSRLLGVAPEAPQPKK